MSVKSQSDLWLQTLKGQSVLFALVCGMCVTSFANAQTREPEVPELAPASDEGARALSAFRIPEGIEGNLFAAEPMVGNPVAIFVDNSGQVYVCETYRQQKGVEDNRGHGDWLDDDLAAQTVEDRLAYIKKFLGDEADEYSRHDDRIRLLVDSDGDGEADRATVFANKFNEIVAGTGAGVLSFRGDVFYTCIPHLWRLRDSDGDGVSDERLSLSSGYGVRFAFRGHDMHGLIVGPDGRLYFSIGDRGYNVTTESGTFKDPASGAVFRCEMDGSNLEVVATGLRNPQELAFDEYGNLFTGDNNSDSGDRARFVYVVPGSDTGWRMYYQYLNDRGPFNREKIWHPYSEETPAYIVPPINNFADGPSGLAYYPGTGLGEQFNGRFFLCDFRGQASNSGIRTLRLKPNGAFFEFDEDQQPFWTMLATDATFGPDGTLYVSDWVHGWEGLNKGRIYTFRSTDPTEIEAGQQVAALLGGDLYGLDDEELIELLSHRDQRVRQEAQFELVGRENASALAAFATENSSTIPRLHAIWGLGQLGRKGIDVELASTTCISLMDDPDSEVRAQAIATVAEIGAQMAIPKLIELTADESLRVRYFAAQGLGMLGDEGSVDALLELIHDNANDDPIVRHGGIMGLVGAASDEQLVSFTEHHSRFVRLAAVVAMRKRGLDQVAAFLADSDEAVVVEAARAIHDLPLVDAYPALAAMIGQTMTSDALARRVINANFRLAKDENLAALIEFVAQDNHPEALRLDVLKLLSTWPKPSNRDWVLGDWRPLASRNPSTVQDILRARIPSLLANGGAIARDSASVAAEFGVTETIPYLMDVAGNDDTLASERADALRALNSLQADDIEGLVADALESDLPEFRAAGREVLIRTNPTEAVQAIRQGVFEGTQLERQSAARLLGGLPDDMWAPLKREFMARLLSGNVPTDTHLELLEMAESSSDAEVKSGLQSFEDRRDESDPLSQFAESMVGGNVSNGRSIFFDRRDLSCQRCHQVGDQGGNVGPELTKIAESKDAKYLLESIVLPSKTIAEGFETLLVVTIDGIVLSGILKEETDDELRLMTPEGETIVIPIDDVEETQRGDSSMPNDLVKELTKRELRDLLAFLNSLK